MSIDNVEFKELLEKSQQLEGAMGVVAFAVLEMFRRGGMSEEAVHELHEKMKLHFMRPTNRECNLILSVVEARLRQDRQPNGEWYSE